MFWLVIRKFGSSCVCKFVEGHGLLFVNDGLY